jgi:hypothetical protein
LVPEQVIILIALAFAGMIVILGLWGFFAPNSVSIFVRSWSTVGGMWLAVALRLGFGAALWLAAPLSRTEVPLKVIAGVAAASALVLLVVGFPRFRGLIDSWLKLPSAAVRAWCLVAICLGSFVFWSTMRPIKIEVPENPVEYR